MNWKPLGAILAGVAFTLGAWAWAQQSGQTAEPARPMPQGGQQAHEMMGRQGGMGPGGHQGGMGMGPGMGPGMPMSASSSFERPLISEILRAKEQLTLTPDQEQKLRRLRSDFEKDAIRRGAEIQVAEVDLREVLNAETPDLAKIEAQVKQIASLQGDLRFARIKVLQGGRSVLTRDQWQKFEALGPRPGRMGSGTRGMPGMMGGGDQGMGQGGQRGMMGPGMMGSGGMMMGQGMMGGMAGAQQAAPAPSGGAIRTDSTGPVTVSATLIPLPGDQIAFEVKLDTHSVDLDAYKVDASVLLRNDRGESALPSSTSATGSGHHRGATLAFPGTLAGGGAKRLELLVRDLGGVKERVLGWDAPFAVR